MRKITKDVLTYQVGQRVVIRKSTEWEHIGPGSAAAYVGFTGLITKIIARPNGRCMYRVDGHDFHPNQITPLANPAHPYPHTKPAGR